MSGWLLDTNVVSAFAPGKPSVSPERAQWFEARAEKLFLSVVTVAEIETGIAKLRRSGAERRAETLMIWFERIITLYGDRVLTLDVSVARVAGILHDAVAADGYSPGFADVLMAATAKARGLTVLTRNLRHFETLDVGASDPFSQQA